jgi:hypothetical protein
MIPLRSRSDSWTFTPEPRSIRIESNFSRCPFVDPWWMLYGECYPDWGEYTDFGRLWVYLDSTHTYDGTKRELKLLNRKLRETGLIVEMIGNLIAVLDITACFLQ